MLFIKTNNSNGQPVVAYYHHDELDKPLQATDKAGNVVWAANYNAFGLATVTTPAATEAKPTIMSNLRLPGQYADAETGLLYNYHRYYDSSIGRYITMDPIGFEGGVNKYAYVGGNPVSRVDPLGLDWLSPDGQAAGSGCGDASTDRNIPDSFGTFNFTSACRQHDKCYGACGKAKSQCDNNFYNDMMKECEAMPTWYKLLSKSYNNCKFAATAYYSAVAIKGGDPYKNAQKESCDKCNQK